MPRALPSLLLIGLLATLAWFVSSAWRGEEAEESGLERDGSAIVANRLEAPGTGDDATRANAAPLEAHAAQRAPLRLLLFDQATDEPLPAYLVQLVAPGGGQRSEHTTDEQGRIATDALPFGDYTIEAIDHIELYAHHVALELEHTGADEHELRVASGPTFDVKIDLPTGADVRALDVWLESRAPRTAFIDDTGVRAPLRQDGVRLWCRFRRQPAGFGDLRQLVIQDPEEVWVARAPTTHARGICPYAPRFHLQFTGRLEFAFDAPAGLPTNDVRIALHPLPAQPIDMTGFEVPEYALDMRGATWPRLPWGDYRATVTSARFERIVEIVRFRDAELRVPIALEPLPIGGEISGTVRATGGEVVHHARVRLSSASAPDLQLEAIIQWQEHAGSVTGTFRIPAVPKGTWRVTPISRDWELWTPHDLEVVAPATGLSFEVSLALAKTDLQFNVRHAHSSEELHDFRVSAFNGNGSTTGVRSNVRSGVMAVPAVPDGVPLRWRIERAGFQTLIGDETAFTGRLQRNGRDVRVAPVTLVPE